VIAVLLHPVHNELAMNLKLFANCIIFAGTALAFLLAASAATPADWPGFLGPNRDGHSPDTGLLQQWPEDGPPLIWKIDNLGPGWSSIAVSNGNLYTTGNENEKQMLICLDLDGQQRWRVEQGPQCDHRRYPGARSTPTVDGDRIYVTGGNGLVTCHSTTDGRILWKRDMKKEMSGKVGGWQYAESVLILDDLAIVTPGGEQAMVALDKRTGKDAWRSEASVTAGYSSCITVTEGGDTVIVNGSQSGLIIVDAKNGKLLHLHEFAVRNTANVPTPAYTDGMLFWGVGYGKGSVCIKVDNDAGQWSFEEAWRNTDLSCHPGNYVVADTRVFGKGKGGLVCVDLKSGETLWKEPVRAGQVCWADSMLYVLADSGGQLSLVDPNAGETKTKGAFSVEGEGRSWAHPVVIDGRLLIRYDTNLYCFNVKAR
jgi:outer membrane protein assembly factor BamB